MTIGQRIALLLRRFSPLEERLLAAEEISSPRWVPPMMRERGETMHEQERGVVTTRQRITHILLWLSTVVWGCMLGGIVYETLVIVPTWTAALPESLAIMTHPSYPIVPGRMWVPFSGLHTLMTLAVLIFAWNQRSRRMWLLFAMVVVVLSHIMQFAYFWPRNLSMIEPGVTPAEIASIAGQWRAVNWFRVGYIAAGFLATLRAFRLPGHP